MTREDAIGMLRELGAKLGLGDQLLALALEAYPDLRADADAIPDTLRGSTTSW